VRTFADWGDPPPGYLECDLVEHCGGVKVGGNFVHTLTLTDIHSGWTECAALAVREQSLVVEGISAIAQCLPFALRGLDTDNDRAFMNGPCGAIVGDTASSGRAHVRISRTTRPGSSRRMARWCGVWQDTGD